MTIKDGWIKHKMFLRVDVHEFPIDEGFKEFIPALVEDGRDRLANERFGEGNWAPDTISDKYQEFTVPGTYDDDDGTIREYTSCFILVRASIWGPVDENYDYGQKSWGLSE